ncbi:DUF3243 family protein, partial [Bacillus sp. D-CC]
MKPFSFRFLGERLEQAEGKGLNSGAVSDMAFRVGDYYTKKIERRFSSL